MIRFAIFAFVLMITISIATYLVYRHFERKQQRKLEREREQRELDEQLIEVAESEYGND